MKLDIKKFAGDPWKLTTSFSNYKYNTNGELIQVTLTIINVFSSPSIIILTFPLTLKSI